MLLKKQLQLFIIFLTQQFNSQDNQAKEENENTDAVDAVHISNPFIFWPVWIFFPQVEIFRYLFQDSHIKLNRLKPE